MIKASDIKFIDFLQLSDKDRSLLEEAYLVQSCTLEFDCMNWTWGDVLKCREMLSSQLTYENVLEIAQMEAKKLTMYSPASTVFQAYNEIAKQMAEMVENEQLAYETKTTPKEKAAADEVGGFDMFGFYPQSFQLCKLLNCSYSEVQRTPYYVCFTALAYNARFNNYQSILYKPTEQ